MLIAGWPSASRAGVAMFGTDDDIYAPMESGRLSLAVRVTGLSPGEPLAIVATGEYEHAWFCGSQPGHTFLGATEGTTKDSGRALARSDGTVTLRVELVATPPAEACPVEAEAPWASAGWSNVRVTDATHRIVLTPPEIVTGP